jgi:hypothetical protein
MDNILINLKTASTGSIVDEIMDNYFTALFVGKMEGNKEPDIMEISILTVFQELEDDTKFIESVMYLVRQGREGIQEYYWARARELCTELVQQAKEDYYYE